MKKRNIMSDKTKKNDSTYLTGKLLLAMPGMGDPRFDRAVIFMCAHDENGAMGLMINKAMPGIDFSDLLEQLDIKVENPKQTKISDEDFPIMNGGPVEEARGFILHSNEFEEPDTVKIGNEYGVTGTIDAIKRIANDGAPDNMLFVLGYAGWSAGQLDQEIQANAWLTLDPEASILFHDNQDKKWDMAIEKLGIDPALLSTEAGRA